MDKYRVSPGSTVDLDAWDPEDTGIVPDKERGKALLTEGLNREIGKVVTLATCGVELTHQLLCATPDGTDVATVRATTPFWLR